MSPQVVTTLSSADGPVASSPEKGKENSNTSLPNASSPESDSFDRKSKELETAKNLIKQMQADRTNDRKIIAELRTQLEEAIQAQSKRNQTNEEAENLEKHLTELKSVHEENEGLKTDLDQMKQENERFESDLERMKRENERMENEKSDEISRMKEKFSEEKLAFEKELNALKIDHEQIVADLRNQFESSRGDFESQLKSLSDNVAQRDLSIASLQGEKELVQNRISSLESELEKSAQNLESVTLQRVADETRFKDEISRLTRVHGEEVKQMENEFAKQFSTLRSQIDSKSDEVETLTKSLNAAKQHEIELKKEFEQRKSDLEKRIRTAEQNQVHAEDCLSDVRKKLSKAEAEIVDLNDQIENLENEKNGLNDSISTLTLGKQTAEKMASDAQDKYKQVTHKLTATEKQLKTNQDLVDDLKKQLEDKSTIVKRFTNDLAVLRRATDDKVRNVAVIAAVIAFVISRLLAALFA